MTQSLTTFEIPATMRAAVLREPGAGLKVETIRTPHPKEGEILLKVAACGLCHSDLHVISGAIAFPTPAVLGHEVAGTIVGSARAMSSPACRWASRPPAPSSCRVASAPSVRAAMTSCASTSST